MNETILNVLKAMDKEAPATIDMIEKVEKNGMSFYQMNINNCYYFQMGWKVQ
jgi:hypothetical protein